MLPTNVMSFVKKIVSSGAPGSEEGNGAAVSGVGGLRERSPARPQRQTGVTMSPVNDGQVRIGDKPVTSPVPEGADMSHLTTEEITILQKVFEKQQQFEKEEATRRKGDNPKSVCRSNACRICLKGLVATDVFHMCCECQQKVCEDCSSYSRQGDSKDSESWKCSICRRKQADLQKLQDPDVTLRILQRSASRKAAGNGAASMTAVSQLRIGSEAVDKIDTTPKLRPRTLDTSGGGSALSSSGGDTLGLRSQNNNNRAKTPVGSLLDKESKKILRERGSNDSAPQTPVDRSGVAKHREERSRLYVTGNRSSLESDGGKRGQRHSKHGDYYLSDDNPAESHFVPVHHPALRHVYSDSLMQHQLSPDLLKDRRSSRPRHSPSTSDSSVDDGWKEDTKEQDHWKRKKSKIKRRSRMQRQRSYHDDLDADALNVENSQRYGGGLNRTGSKEDHEGGSENIGNYNYIHDYRRNQRDQLDVPGHSKIFRHHSWDASLSARRYSSESSDISDVSVDYPGSLDQEEALGSGGSGGVSGGNSGGVSPRSTHLNPKPVRKLIRKKRLDDEDDYDAEQSATMESSPSPEHPERHCFPHIDRRTSSEDSDVFKGNRSRRSSQNNAPSGNNNNGTTSNWPGKIPTVEVHVAADHETTGDHSEPIIKCDSPSVERASGGGGGVGRALPKIPIQAQVRLTPVANSPGNNCPRTRQSKSVDLTPLCSSERNTENLLRRSTLSDFENVKIVIDDVDSDRKDRPTIQRKVTLSRFPIDGGHRTRGFGMRVVGGKIGEDGKLFAYVVWTVPGGPAEENGVAKGDKILEWDGETLIDRTFEEVCVIMDHSGDEARLLIEHVIDPRKCQTGDFIQRRASEGTPIEILAKESQSGNSPIRRKLPKPPDKPKDHLSGDIQLLLWFDAGQKLLTITVMEADNLPLRNDKSPPEAYAKLRLLPDKNKCTFKTPIAEPSSNPSWNENFNYIGITSDDVVDKFLVVSVWDVISSKDKRALGEIVVQLKKCELDGRPEWYRLRDGCTLTTSASISLSSKSLHVPFTGDPIPKDFSWKRSEFMHTRSLSDDIDDDLALELIGHIVKSTSVDSNLLHPEQAWNRQGRRRSSSGSEKDQSDASTHSCPQSLPSTRKNSFMLDPHQDYASSTSRDKLRSHSFKMPRQDPFKETKESIAVSSKTIDRLSRSLSLKGDRISLSLVNVSNLMDSPLPSIPSPSCSSSSLPKDDDLATSTPPNLAKKEYLAPPSHGKWSSSSSLEASDDDENGSSSHHDHLNASDDIDPSLRLGPGQLSPKNFTGNLGSNQREIKLGVIITKGFMEIDVICARGLGYSSTGQPPDTYVKMYIKEGEKRMQKKKTRVVRHCVDPQYRQTVTYPAGEVIGRFLLVMVWERQKGFDHNHGIGAAQINPDKLELNKLVIGWYRLFPMAKIESESNEST